MRIRLREETADEKSKRRITALNRGVGAATITLAIGWAIAGLTYVFMSSVEPPSSENGYGLTSSEMSTLTELGFGLSAVVAVGVTLRVWYDEFGGLLHADDANWHDIKVAIGWGLGFFVFIYCGLMGGYYTTS